MIKLHVGRLQLYWELHRRPSRRNFLKRLKQYPQLFLVANFFDQLQLKVIYLQEKSAGRLMFWRNKESKFLLGTTAVKKMNSKHSQVLLVFRKNPGKWSYEWSSVLKTCIALIVGIFEQILCFDQSISDGSRKTFIHVFV